jgi:hypothetical protein
MGQGGMMMLNRLLHPKHLDKLWIGQDQYRLLIIFSGLIKNRVPDMGKKWLNKNRVQEILGLCFFQTTKNDQFSLYPFLTFFRTRVLETIQILSKCLVAACRKETEARTIENLQELRNRILEIESDWVAVEILLKTKEISMHQGIGPYRCKLLPKLSDVREGGQLAGCHPAAGKGHPGTGDNCPGQSEAGATQGKQRTGEEQP